MKVTATTVMERCDLLGNISEEADLLVRPFGSQAMREANDIVSGWMRGAGLEGNTLQRVAPGPCSELVRKPAEAACKELGLEPFSLVSGAGHDGMQLTKLCPMGMLFVRSKGGISHNPAEWSSQ
jgi:hypothetical protein